MDQDWNEIMFDNIGKKIQLVARWIAWFDIIGSIIGGVILFIYALSDLDYLWWVIFVTPLIVIIGCISAWLSVITLYGFGKLIEDVEAIRNQNTYIASRTYTTQHQGTSTSSATTQNASNGTPNTKAAHKWRCDNCGEMITRTPCEYCGDNGHMATSKTTYNQNVSKFSKHTAQEKEAFNRAAANLSKDTRARCPHCGEFVTSNRCEMCGKEVGISVGQRFVPNPSKLVVPHKESYGYSCPKCGCTLKKGQKECICTWQMDWSKYE